MNKDIFTSTELFLMYLLYKVRMGEMILEPCTYMEFITYVGDL